LLLVHGEGLPWLDRRTAAGLQGEIDPKYSRVSDGREYFFNASF
jgi:hypothetical protein